MSVNTTDPMIGRLIDGRYQVRSRIARGGMATVYLATDLRLERRVAVKVMHGHLSDDSQFKQRFIQEARSAARLAHPNVVNVFDQGQDSDSAYLVMEYLPGITLRDLLEEYGSLTAQQTIDISEAVLSGLAAAHKAGIVHRDLKPENVLLADDGRIKIGDFGLARAVTANTATGAALLGTIAYLSPELVTRGIADTRSDIYAVGIMMYEMLTGEQPFTGEQPMQIAYRHANEPLPPPSDKKPSVPPELDDLVLWATQKNPDDRPPDARAMLEQVRDAEAAIGAHDASTALQKTVVLPAAPPATKLLPPQRPPARPHADEETQVLGTRRSASAAGGPVGSAVAVGTPPNRTDIEPQRRRRRWIPITVILAVVLLGLGVGWYYLLGPGSRITVPENLTGLSVEEARTVLQEAGLEVAEQTGSTPHPTAAVGSVAETDPPMGESVAPGTTVTLLLSTGPQLFDINLDRGMTQAEAEAIAQEHWTLQDPIRQFDPEVPAGQLIDALDAQAASLLEQTQYGDQQPITLVLSVGAVPEVRGLTVDEATQLLESKELEAVPGDQVFDNDIESGRVIGLAPTPEGQPVRPGQTLTLIVSKGPDLVPIPENIEDLTLREAVDQLKALGFVVDVNTNIPEVFWNLPAAEVDDVSPGAGEQAIRGSTVTLDADA